MKNFRLLLILFFYSIFFTQITSTNLKQYMGTYSLSNKDIEKNRIGSVIIFPDSDNSLLLYFEMNRGAPSYNMSSIYGRLKIKNDSLVYISTEFKLDTSDTFCSLLFTFTNSNLIITYIKDHSNCGFSAGVYAQGIYLKESSTPPNFFIKSDGTKIFFDQTKPEQFD